MNQGHDLSTLTTEQLDALAEEARAKLESSAAADPATVIALARILWDLYQEIRRRVG